MKLVPKDWSKFQHYKNRRPPWIKLHRQMLDDHRFMCLPLASRALAPLLWLIASEEEDGIFDTEGLSWRLRCSDEEVSIGLVGLCKAGLFLDASTMLAPCLQPATSEERRGEERTEKRTEARASTSGAPRPADVEPQVWDDWLRWRKSIKAPFTETAMKQTRTEAGKAGITLQQALEIAIANGWRGFRADYVANARRNGKASIVHETPRNTTISALPKAIIHDPDDQACECDRCFSARRRANGYGERVSS